MFDFLKGNMLIIIITRAIGMFVRHMIFAYAALFVLVLGGTTTSVGFVESLRSLASILIFPIAGFFADRFGR